MQGDEEVGPAGWRRSPGRRAPAARPRSRVRSTSTPSCSSAALSRRATSSETAFSSCPSARSPLLRAAVAGVDHHPRARRRGGGDEQGGAEPQGGGHPEPHVYRNARPGHSSGPGASLDVTARARPGTSSPTSATSAPTPGASSRSTRRRSGGATAASSPPLVWASARTRRRGSGGPGVEAEVRRHPGQVGRCPARHHVLRGELAHAVEHGDALEARGAGHARALRHLPGVAEQAEAGDVGERVHRRRSRRGPRPRPGSART